MDNPQIVKITFCSLALNGAICRLQLCAEAFDSRYVIELPLFCLAQELDAEQAMSASTQNNQDFLLFLTAQSLRSLSVLA